MSPFPLPHCTLPVSSVFSDVLLAVYCVLFTSKTIVDQRLKRASFEVAASGLLHAELVCRTVGRGEADGC